MSALCFTEVLCSPLRIKQYNQLLAIFVILLNYLAVLPHEFRTNKVNVKVVVNLMSSKTIPVIG
jgi:hypothetical protein